MTGRIGPAVILLLLLGAALRFGIAGRGVWYDEVLTLRNTESVADALHHCRTDVHPPFYFAAAAAWRAFFPHGEFPLRCFSILFGLLSLVGIFLVARAVGGPSAGLIALLLAVLSPWHWLYSTEMRPYPAYMAFSSFSVWSFLELERRGPRRHWIVFILATALNLYTHYFALFLLGAQAATFALLAGIGVARSEISAESAARRLLLFAGSLAVIATLYLPWVRELYSLVHASVVQGETVGVGARIGRGMTIGHVVEETRLSLGWGWAPAGLSVLLLLVALARKPLAAGAVLFVAMWALPLAALWLNPPSHFVAGRYFIYAYPLAVTLVARGLLDLGARPGTAGKVVPVAAAVLALLQIVPGQAPPYAFHRQDLKKAESEVRRLTGEGDRISFPKDARTYVVFRHYDPELFKDRTLVNYREENGVVRFVPSPGSSPVYVVGKEPLPGPLLESPGGSLELLNRWDLYPKPVVLYRWAARPGYEPTLPETVGRGLPRVDPAGKAARSPAEEAPAGR